MLLEYITIKSRKVKLISPNQYSIYIRHLGKQKPKKLEAHVAAAPKYIIFSVDR